MRWISQACPDRSTSSLRMSEASGEDPRLMLSGDRRRVLLFALLALAHTVLAAIAVGVWTVWLALDTGKRVRVARVSS